MSCHYWKPSSKLELDCLWTFWTCHAISTGLSPAHFFDRPHWPRGWNRLNINNFSHFSYKEKKHSRSQRPRCFWSAPRIATSDQVQRHSGFEWICKHNRLRPEPIRFVRLDSEHAQSDGKSVNRGLLVLDLARGRDYWCWPKGARPLETRVRKKTPLSIDQFVMLSLVNMRSFIRGR